MTEALQAGQSRPAPVSPAWTLLAAHATTGKVVGRLPLAALTWSLPLGLSGGSLQPTVHLDGPPGADDRSLTRRVRTICADGPRFLLVAVYGTRAIAYGFVSAPVPSPSGVQIGTMDLAGLLNRRRVIKPGERANPSSLEANTSLGPTSKANIARLLLLQAIAEDGGALPLDIPAVGTAGAHVRNYLGADLASYTERLSDLGDDVDGPDLRVTPVLSADQQWITLRVDIGEPYLGQTGQLTFSYPGSCRDVLPDYDFGQMGAWHYVPGDGVDQDKPVGVAERTTLLNAGVPLMDRVDTSHGSTKDQALLDGYAAGNAEVYENGLESLTLTVAADTDPALGTYAPGDELQLRLSQHWWLDDGLHRRRIVTVSGDHTNVVTVKTAPAPEGLV